MTSKARRFLSARRFAAMLLRLFQLAPGGEPLWSRILPGNLLQPCALALLIAGSAVQATAQVIARVTDLACGGSTYSYALGINNSGQVVGSCTYPDGTFAFLYSAGVRTPLGTLGGPYSFATAINASGQVVGISQTATGTVPFLYSAGTLAPLGSLGDGVTPNAINASGQVVGQYLTPNGPFRGFLYSGGVMTDLPTVGGPSSALGINDSGQVVGSSGSGAFLYSGGDTTYLAADQAVAINDTAQIVVIAGTHSFLYSGGSMTDLGLLGGYYDGNNVHQNFATGTALNARGQVVGYTITSGPFGANTQKHAWLYSGGIMTDLNSLLPANSGLDTIDSLRN